MQVNPRGFPPSSPAPCFPFPRTRGGGDLSGPAAPAPEPDSILQLLRGLPPPFPAPTSYSLPTGPIRLSSFESKKYRATIFLVDSPCLIFVCSLTPPFPQKCLHYDRQWPPSDCRLSIWTRISYQRFELGVFSSERLPSSHARQPRGPLLASVTSTRPESSHCLMLPIPHPYLGPFVSSTLLPDSPPARPLPPTSVVPTLSRALLSSSRLLYSFSLPPLLPPARSFHIRKRYRIKTPNSSSLSAFSWLFLGLRIKSVIFTLCC